ncbi:MAG: ABC-2 transporter permease [Thermomonas sp.]
MNTSVETTAMNIAERPRPVRAAPHATHKFKLLLKREFWEHKGGFLWAPIWAGAISMVLTLMALIFGEVAARRAFAEGKFHGDSLGTVNINGLDLGMLSSKMDAKNMHDLAGGIDMSMLTSSMWPLMVLGFVVFFYCLGTLYDERKDRSVLFWKSLPVSDRDTVLSKLISALVVAPTLAIGAAIATMFAFLIMISGFVLLHNGNPMELIWGPGSPLKIVAALIACIPVYALWALPTVGWLMLCSAWSRSKPFLWAILLPVFSGIIVTWFGLMNVFSLDAGWFWRNVVARGLTSVFPGTWYMNDAMKNQLSTHLNGPGDIANAIQIGKSWAVFGTAELWIGALVGAIMIYAAIRLRRWRDDS